MKVSQILGAAGLGVLLCGPLAARQASAAVQTSAAAIQIDDDTLESHVGATLKRDSILAPRHIDAEAKNGVVTLTGTVPTIADKERAGSLAKIAGVNAVVNQIEVDPRVDQSKTDAAADKTKAGMNKAVDATAKGAKKTAEGVEKGVGEAEKGIGKAADKTGDALDKTGDKMSDTSMTTRVKTEFTNEPLLKASAIDVHTTNHVVTLKGRVPSVAAKARAEEIAAGVSGVTRVVNDLVVQ